MYFNELEELNEVMRVDEEIDDLLYNQLIDSTIVDLLCESLKKKNIVEYIDPVKVMKIMTIK